MITLLELCGRDSVKPTAPTKSIFKIVLEQLYIRAIDRLNKMKLPTAKILISCVILCSVSQIGTGEMLSVHGSIMLRSKECYNSSDRPLSSMFAFLSAIMAGSSTT